MRSMKTITAVMLTALLVMPQAAFSRDDGRSGAKAQVSNTQSGFARQHSSTTSHRRVVTSGNGFVVVPPNTTRNYGARSYEGYGAGYSAGNSTIYMGSGYPGGYDPYGNPYGTRHWRERDGYRWGKDNDRDAFHRHHRGPGWEKHWEHHRKSMRKK